tara:strand:+ start:1595 stop:2536 length:942 start_codon:yes stop_codon:yes gene_type:complete
MVCAVFVPQPLSKKSATPPRIALAFYGLFRAVPFTFANLKANLISPLSETTPFLDIFLHSLLVSQRIVEDRGGKGKNNTAAPDPFAFIKFNATRRLCSFSTENQLVVDTDNHIVERAKEAWAAKANRNLRFKYGYTLSSFLNILRATYSLFSVSKLIRAREREGGFTYSHLVFARPDIQLNGPLRLKDYPFKVKGHVVMVPNSQHYGGINDRFAFGTREAMLHLATQFEAEAAAALPLSGQNSERRRAVHLNSLSPNVTVAFTPLCLVRVRSTGAVVERDKISKRQQFHPLPRLVPLFRPKIDNLEPCGGAGF